MGYLHPTERVIGFLKYYRDPKGSWGGKERYSRAMPYYHVRFVADSLNSLFKQYPQYVWWSPVHFQLLPAIPLSKIRRFYFPEEMLHKIIDETVVGDLEAKASQFVNILADRAGVPLEIFGITGSILLGIANPKFSDLNLTFQGKQYIEPIHKTLIKLMEKKQDGFGPIPSDKNEDWLRSRAMRFPLSYRELKILRKRKWNNGDFEGTFFSLTPIRKDEEIKESYGDRFYKAIGSVKVQAVIVDSSESCYNPAIYRLGELAVLKSSISDIGAIDIGEVVSYEGIYANYARTGERVEIFGVLEEIMDRRNGAISYRIVLGTTQLGSQEYMRVL
ncbi:MAG: hypothetical protein ACTSYO_09390 [Candidatus Ranarchaeia archaeon]